MGCFVFPLNSWLEGHRWGASVQRLLLYSPKKRTIPHSQPLHAMIDQVCGGEKGASLCSSPFYLWRPSFLWEQPSATLWMTSWTVCLKMCAFIPRLKEGRAPLPLCDRQFLTFFIATTIKHFEFPMCFDSTSYMQVPLRLILRQPIML